MNEEPETDGRSDLKVVLQFFIVPLSLVMVLVSVFFGLQIMRRHRPDVSTTLRSLEAYEGFLARYVGDVKRWQSGYDLSLLLRGDGAGEIRAILPDLVNAFHQAGARRDLKLRRYLALALGRSADPAAVAPLREGLADSDPQTRLFACWGLVLVGDRSVLPDLRAAAADPDAGLRKAAIFGLGRLGDRDAQPLLRTALEDAEADVRWNAALALARLGDPAAVPVLVGLLDASAPPSPNARPEEVSDRKNRALNAIRGLALLRSPQARGPLGGAAEGASDPEVREAARLALQVLDAGSGGVSP